MKVLKWHRATLFASCGALALSLAACASDKREVQNPSGSSSVAVAAQEEKKEDTADMNWMPRDKEATVQVSPDFRTRCALPESPDAAPRFDYDKAALRGRGENVLDFVAKCLVDGPLKSETITIIGRADPRGTEQYNSDLAASRAAAARTYLMERGVPAGRVLLMSRGEEGARGNDEATWALDRRVDLELGDRTAAAERRNEKSPIIQGTRLQVESAESRPAGPDAASYADTAEGGKPTGGSAQSASASSSKGSASTSGSSSGSKGSVSVTGSASGSAK